MTLMHVAEVTRGRHEWMLRIQSLDPWLVDICVMPQ